MHAVLASSLVAVITISGSSGELTWLDNYGEALQLARDTQKPLLIVIDDSSQAQRFDHVRLASDATQVQLLSGFQLCRIDASTEYGQRVAEVFRAEQFPFVAMTDNTGTWIKFRSSGSMSRDEWTSTLVARRQGESIRASSVSQRSSSQFDATWPAYRRSRFGGRICFT